MYLWACETQSVLIVFSGNPQSLTGHSNPVECVQFKGSEEQVVAGSQSGSLRVWDLEAAKSETELCLLVCNLCIHLHAC